jgi:hypothetical protein
VFTEQLTRFSRRDAAHLFAAAKNHFLAEMEHSLVLGRQRARQRKTIRLKLFALTFGVTVQCSGDKDDCSSGFPQTMWCTE